MTPIWSQPRTWLTGELATAALLNQHLRDNLDWLKTPPVAVQFPTSTVVVTSTAFTDIWSPLNLTTAGGGLLIGVVSTVSLAGVGQVGEYDLMLDGVSQGGTDGVLIFYQPVANYYLNGSFTYYIPPIAAGAHTIKLRARVAVSNTLSIYASTVGVKSQIWVREV
mgnify:CR=1 FL=1